MNRISLSAFGCGKFHSVRFRSFKGALVLAAFALFSASSRGAAAQNATAMSQVQSVFVRRANGNAFFNAQLRAELQARGFRFVKSARGADAFLETSGNYVRGGFRGQMSFIGRGGRVLLRENVLRKSGSNTMAHQSLARKVRAPKR